jgi:hypothetical protein
MRDEKDTNASTVDQIVASVESLQQECTHLSCASRLDQSAARRKL